MNIFEIYKKKIKDLVTLNYKIFNIEPNINFEDVVIETPPQEFNFDLSSNIALILAKKTKQSPIKLANLIKDLLFKGINEF